MCVVSLDGNIEETLQQIEEIQSNIDRLNEKASDEILLVEQRFVKMRQPFYQVYKLRIVYSHLKDFMLIREAQRCLG